MILLKNRKKVNLKTNLELNVKVIVFLQIVSSSLPADISKFPIAGQQKNLVISQTKRNRASNKIEGLLSFLGRKLNTSYTSILFESEDKM